jgi:hypothetical protein
MTVRLDLGTGRIEGGTVLTIRRVRYELDCNANAGLGIPCADQGDIFSYLGDATIVSNCDGGPWSSNVPSGGNGVNEIVFTPSVPLDLLAYSPACSIWFDVGLDNTQPTKGPASDSTPLLTEVVAGFSAVAADASCNNGLASIRAQAVAIQMPAPTSTTPRKPH